MRDETGKRGRECDETGWLGGRTSTTTGGGKLHPPKAAFEMLTTGAFIEAQRACELGVINRVVPGIELSEATMALAQTVAAKLPAAIALGKQAFHQQRGLDLAEAYRLASAEMCENALWPDTAEGTAAFLEKRRPLWQAPR